MGSYSGVAEVKPVSKVKQVVLPPLSIAANDTDK